RTAELTSANQALENEIRQRSELEQEILLISEREKRRIGQDLHDSLCQELAAAALFLQSTAQKLGPKKVAEVKALTEAAKIVNDNVGLARDLARGLHPVELGLSGLTNALRELAFRTHDGVTCRFECPKPIRIRDDVVSLNLYRIAQEAVTNALKHAQPKEIVISLLRNRSGLILTVDDDGKGLPEKPAPDGMGLHIMGYRANAIGATCEAISRRGGGTRLRCVLPPQ
ncbi:MAG: sensor histidine kinase, partial [Chthoniobacterales bacterium]